MDNIHRHILVTSALPYANGAIHLGHLVEHIQTDIWVRFQKSRGHSVVYICGDDAHGTPIMISAEKRGIEPEALLQEVYEQHQQDFKDFLIEFDNYYTTHSEENRELAEFIYHQLHANGDISKRKIEQAFDPVKNMFLPDRFVKGTCPRCKTADQYGDSCESCGATYSPMDLIDPVSTLSQATPIQKSTEHLFFELSHYEQWLREWLQGEHVKPHIRNKLQEWFDTGLVAWDISRDAPYFGFEIPDHPGQYFYVWLDAPVGYMASLKNLAHHRSDLPLSFDDYWGEHSPAECHHFIGKDIIYFHALFWPAMLRGAGFRTPTKIHAHGFLTVNGEKMSKSRGTFINARDYLSHCQPEYLRYYFACKLSDGVDDIDLNFEDFINRINSDLVGKIVNIASRCAKFIHQYADGQLATHCPNLNLFDLLVNEGDAIAESFEAVEFAKAMRQIAELADHTNRYIDEQKPWVLAKDPQRIAEVIEICTLGLNCFKVIMTYLKPVLPTTAAKVEDFLQIEPMTWENRNQYCQGHQIKTYEPLATRLSLTDVQALIHPTTAKASNTSIATQSTQTVTASFDLAATSKAADIKPAATETSAKATTAEKSLINFDDFSKLDLRIARIDAAEVVEGADKLLKLTLNIGDDQTRQVFAGIKPYFEPEDIIGKFTVMVANLEPRKMRFGLSEGMVIGAVSDDNFFLIEPAEGATPGLPVR